MGRMKEEEKIERTIRGLSKLPENRRCINCNSLGPQYVCTTFLTFVCTNCSGVHREFTHRVKSVSVAKFTTEEVSALQAGGNERARQIYFKDWDPQRHSFPDGSNLHRLRDFIKHVYVDRKFTGERSNELPRLRLSNKDESIESKKFNIFQSRSRSPRNEGSSEKRDKERSSPSGINDDRNIYYYDERNSPRYYQSNSRYGGYKRSPVRFEIVDDRFRDDEFGNRRFSSGENMSRSRSPDRKKNIYGSNSPVVNSSKMLGEKMKALKFVEVSKSNDEKDANDSTPRQKKIASCNDLESANGNPVEHGNTVFHEKRKSVSLIDFSTECEPPDFATMSQSQQVSSSNSSSSQTLIETSIKEMPNENSLENLLFALVPSTPYGDNKREAGVPLHTPVGQMPDLFSSVTSSSTRSTVNVLEQPSSAAEQSPHSSNRMELPMDLFSASYSTIPAPVSGWQTGPPPGGMGFDMHYYPNAMPVPAFSNSASSTNPFDINDERSQVQTTPFSSMTMTQGVQPNVSSPISLMPTSSSGTHSSQLKAPQASSPNASMIPLQFPSSGSDLSHSAYAEQQVQNNMITSSPQGSGGFGDDGAAFGSFNTTQQPTIRNSAPGNTTPFTSMGGNPFE